MKKIASSAKLRSRAWAAMKATWPTILALTCATNFASYVLNQLVGFVPGPIGAIMGYVVSAVIMIPITGVTKGTLGYLRGRPLTFDCIGSMLPHAWKIVCLDFWQTLFIYGWMLPGVVLMLIGVPMLPLELWSTRSETIILIGVLLVVAGLVLMLAMMIPASLSYSMCTCVFIDDPSVGARNALRKSRAMIRGYRWHYVKMGMPLFIGILGLAYLTGLLTTVLPGWLGSMIVTASGVVTATMSHYFLPVMYEELKRIGR